MATQRQIIANRANALLSTGPTSHEGGEISSRNSRGPVAAFLCINSENREAFEALQQGWFDCFQPANDVESNLVDEIVMARWRQQRLWIMETVVLNKAMQQIQDDDPSTTYASDVLQGLAAIHLCENSKTWATLQRYERECRRNYERAVKELRALQSERLAAAEPPAAVDPFGPNFFRALESMPSPLGPLTPIPEIEPNSVSGTEDNPIHEWLGETAPEENR